MVSFFNTLERTDTKRTAQWLSSHPAPSDRRARIEKEAALLGIAPATTTATARLTSVQGRLRGTSAGSTALASGSTTGATGAGLSVPAPSRELRSYTSPSRIYRVAYPSNWKVYEEGPTGVTIAPPGGIVSARNRSE